MVNGYERPDGASQKHRLLARQAAIKLIRTEGTLLARVRKTDVIDAAIVLLAENGDRVLRSDPDDLGTLTAPHRLAGRSGRSDPPSREFLCSEKALILELQQNACGDPSNLVPTDNPNPESGAYATPRVFTELLLMYLRGGECGNGQRALSEQAIDRMLADRVATSYGGAAAPGVGYGMGWWINRRSGLAYSTGAYGAVPTLRIDEGFGYYIVLEVNDNTWQALAAPLNAAIEAAVLAARN